jgi:hypothetical protein
MDMAEAGILLEALECHAYGLEKRIDDAPVDDGGATASIVRQELETVDLWIETIQDVLDR